MGQKGKEGILLGCSDVGYRVLVENKIKEYAHVQIVEENINLIGSEDTDSETENESENDFESADEDGESEIKETENKMKELDLTSPRRSTRVRTPPCRYPEVESHNVYALYCRVDTPSTFQEACANSENKNWKRAMDREMNSINENKTWKLVDKVKNEKALDLRWVYTRKSDNRFKARLVVKGFQQANSGFEDIYSPVARNQTLKLLLAFCVQNGMIIQQMDVESAFLNGKVCSEVYVKQPEGYSDGTQKVYKLIKALYGLRESPRAWYECFDEFVIRLGFKRSKVDLCLYRKGSNNDTIYLLIYVDD